MLLLAVATEKEIVPLKHFLEAIDGVEILITGMGPVATAATLSHYLALHSSRIHGVLNVGVAGAYVNSNIAMLDICIAQQEFLGDFGICMQSDIRDFEPGLINTNSHLLLNNDLLTGFESILNKHGIAFKMANFVTVNCCSGTRKRGELLREKFGAGCENMEGAAVVMVCKNFNLPCMELRCISNMVEDRHRTNWQLAEAIEKICRVVEIVLHDHLQKRSIQI